MLYNRVDNISEDLRSSLTLVHDLCETINTPRSLAVSLLLQYGEWEQYLDLPMDFSTYQDPLHAAEDYQVTVVLRKHPDLPLGIDRAQVALDSFKESETECTRTRERLRSDKQAWQLVFQQHLRSLLGPLSSHALQFMQRKMGHGPGATTGVRGVGSSMSNKYDNEIHTTVSLIPFTKAVMGDLWWEHHNRPFNIVDGSRFTTVPKSAKTNRGICVEPTFNMYIPRRIGQYLRKRLRRFGINLNSQYRNQQMAKDAYLKGYATIDLSAASDSVSSELILQHFPEDWFHLLDVARSPSCVLPDGSTVELEKWSSMGNGYTFELETLIFYAVCLTFVPFEYQYEITVYGDDIIVPTQFSGSVIDALSHLGFKVNTQKSFLAGNFFESCGCDYFKGRNIRPFSLKGASSPFSLANALRLWAQRIGGSHFCPSKYQGVWERARMRIPRHLRKLTGPAQLGDAVLLVSLSESNCVRPNNWIEGYVVKQLVAKPVRKRYDTLGVLLSAYHRNADTRFPTIAEGLLSVMEGNTDCLRLNHFTYGRETVRGMMRQPRPKTIIVSQWSSGLAWS